MGKQARMKAQRRAVREVTKQNGNWSEVKPGVFVNVDDLEAIERSQSGSDTDDLPAR